MSDEQVIASRHYNAEDLFQTWAGKDPTVHAVMSAWKHGHFASFEAALIHLSVTLAAQNAEFMSQLVKAKWSETPVVVVSQNFCK